MTTTPSSAGRAGARRVRRHGGVPDWYQGFGHLVLLDHGRQWFSLYAHLDRITVRKGAQIAQGAPVGDVGDTGRLGGPALYFELRRGARAVNPAAWLRGLEVGPPAR